MKHLSDDTLSAFLDHELPAHEMDAVRDALVEDPVLTDRLAQLTLVDEQVKQYAATIDKHPVPEATLKLLSTYQANSHQRWWQNASQRVFAGSGQRFALAASLCLVFGSVAGYLIAPTHQSTDSWTLVAEQLGSAPSGQTIELADGQRFTGQFSFHATAGELCRVYQLESAQSMESIACWQAQAGWQNILTTYPASAAAQEYSLASGSLLMQQQVAALQATPPLNLAQEGAALQELQLK